MVLDRAFLWIFTLACVLGTIGIIFQAPSLYDTREPVDLIYSTIPARKARYMIPVQPFLEVLPPKQTI